MLFPVCCSLLSVAAQTAEQTGTPPTGPPDTQQLPTQLLAYSSLLRQGEFGKAESGLRELLRQEPGLAEAHFLLGYALYREQKPRDSLAEYTAGARFRKPGANDLAAVAMDYVLLHDYADAEKWMATAANWSPKDALYWYYLGRIQYSQNRFAAAIQAFESCLKLSPRDVKAEYNLGLSLAGLGRSTDAVAAYKTAIAWQSGTEHQDPQPYLDLGVSLLEGGGAQAALPNLLKAAAIDPKNPRIHEELGHTYEQLHSLPSAQAELERAVSLADNVSSLHFELGRIYAKEGMREKAQQQFARCASLDATHSTELGETPNPAEKEP